MSTTYVSLWTKSTYPEWQTEISNRYAAGNVQYCLAVALKITSSTAAGSGLRLKVQRNIADVAYNFTKSPWVGNRRV